MDPVFSIYIWALPALLSLIVVVIGLRAIMKDNSKAGRIAIAIATTGFVAIIFGLGYIGSVMIDCDFRSAGRTEGAPALSYARGVIPSESIPNLK